MSTDVSRRVVVAVLACVTVAALAGACGASTSAGTFVGDTAVTSAADALRDEGRVAYYLGPEADGLALTNIERVTENGPDFQFWASYGTCSPGMLQDGGCMDPLSVSTSDWRSDATGLSCRRLEPRLGVPAGVLNGELTLFTERVQVRVLHGEDFDGSGTTVDHGLAVLLRLRLVGGSGPVEALPPPDPEVQAWVDGTCGTVPGQSVEHPVDEPPGTLDDQP